MNEIQNIRRTDRTVQHWWKEVSDAAQAFEARWMMLSLQRVDPELAMALQEERDAFDQATIVGSSNEVENLGASVCRGLAAATKAMESAGAAETAYMLGADPATGFKLAIGMNKGSAGRVRQMHGEDYTFHTPDELAAILGTRIADGDRQVDFMVSVKTLFPGAELVQRSK
jgi:hypothetical protein